MMHACSRRWYTAIGLSGLAHTSWQNNSSPDYMASSNDFSACRGTRGARAMVDAGVVDDVDYFNVHIGTGVPAGTVVCGSDNFMATTKFDAHFTGTARSRRRKTRRRSQCLVGGSISHSCTACNRPAQARASRVNVGVMQAGSGRNVVPASALLKVETRGASDVINQYVFDRAQQAIQGAATMYGVGVETRLMGAATASSPSPQWVAWLQSQAAQVAGVNQAIERVEAPAGSEDATLMMARVQQHQGQASYVVFGIQLAAGHHNEKFDFDEQVLAIAVETLARTALNFPWTRGI